MSHDLVFVGRVIVKAVVFQSFVLQLNKTQRWHFGPDLYATTDPTQGSEGNDPIRKQCLPRELDLMGRVPDISRSESAFPFYAIGKKHNPHFKMLDLSCKQFNSLWPESSYLSSSC